MRAEILPPAGEQHCRSGFLCGLEVCITRLTEPAEGEMAEESKTDTDGLKTTKLMYEGMSGERVLLRALMSSINKHKAEQKVVRVVLQKYSFINHVNQLFSTIYIFLCFLVIDIT